ncbi:uncharacterized protein K444DRAFT_629161 [Hyaloscypha bicolor E]|uniref:Uncharacterized protein n=1 Tax=Hyaloscypha bicolor E TaxID=1095630 RepID=A0A2J6TCH0_9HELO|nr:uncharacterized protein K444DRAFT_629161 [Hyaloscypha bicolor E]PMD60672.1 hypothetical protein K444DRAFT_629161 [Hyaloscypha bicolor E]
MASYTEGLLRNQLREVKDWASVNTSRLNAEKLSLPSSESYNQSFMKLETRNANITTNVVMLGAANRVRQEWKLRMPQEDFNSAVLADLVQSEELLTQIKEFREDLRRLKAIAKHQERVDKMVMSRLKRLRIKPSSIAQENVTAGTSKPKETNSKVEKRVHVRAVGFLYGLLLFLVE